MYCVYWWSPRSLHMLLREWGTCGRSKCAWVSLIILCEILPKAVCCWFLLSLQWILCICAPPKEQPKSKIQNSKLKCFWKFSIMRSEEKIVNISRFLYLIFRVYIEI
jgi:hypothetical protein